MKNLLLALLFLPMLAFGASVPFSGANPNQIGVNASTGRWWITNGATVTNLVVIQVLEIKGNSAGTSFIVETNQFVVTTNGLVGIGTANPTATLHTKSPASTDNGVIFDTTSVDQDSYFALLEAGVEKWRLRNQGDGADRFRWGSAANARAFTMFQNGHIKLNGEITLADSSWLSLSPGSAAAATAPIKFTTGPLMTIPEDGAIEFLDGTFYIRRATNNWWVGGITTSSNGVGSLANDAAVNIAATGYTNLFGKNAIVYLDGTAVTFIVKNGAGTPVYTNAVSLTGEATVLLQPGGAVVTSGTGVAGRATPF